MSWDAWWAMFDDPRMQAVCVFVPLLLLCALLACWPRRGMDRDERRTDR